MRERPFEYLKRRADGQKYGEGTIQNWYRARTYVLDALKDVAFSPTEENHLHVIVHGDSELMLAVVRQVFLSAHYMNYCEYDAIGCPVFRNRSVVTLVSRKRKEVLMSALNDERCLGNLLKYCKYSVFEEKPINEESFIDVELQIVKTVPKQLTGRILEMTEEEVKQYTEEVGEGAFSIETDKAVLASRVYKLGEAIENLPAENIHNTLRYTQALDTFQHLLLKDKIERLIDPEKWNNLTNVTNGLSNIFCADCFESRKNSVEKYRRENCLKENEAWKECNEMLSRSEHNRWVVEKLILGFDMLSNEQRVRYERLFGASKLAYAKSLKKDTRCPAHIDLCSYHNLRRIDPNNLKYDSFLMLSIPKILEKTSKPE